MNVTILGTGAYGLALALVFFENNCRVTMWTKFEDEKKDIERKRENKNVLPNIKIPIEIKFTCNMKSAINGADIIVIAIPAAYVDDIANELNNYLKKEQHILIASKGIEQDTCLFPFDVVKKYVDSKNIAVISGPSFAVDIAAGVPIGLSLACKNTETIKKVIKALSNHHFKLHITDDILGISLCGSIKNVIAIAAGILSGMGMPESTQAMFVTESLNDIKNLIKSLGGNKDTILSFAGVGDLLLTSTSTKSRNFCLGVLLGKGESRKKIEEYISNTTIEGLYTLKSIYTLINNKKVNMPIIDLIYDIIYDGREPKDILTFLCEKE